MFSIPRANTGNETQGGIVSSRILGSHQEHSYILYKNESEVASYLTNIANIFHSEHYTDIPSVFSKCLYIIFSEKILSNDNDLIVDGAHIRNTLPEDIYQINVFGKR
jgi:hypothetical protein